MNTIDKAYQNLLQDILDNGREKRDRTGTGTISVFGRQIRHKMSEGFPLLTTKKMAFKTMVTELLWFLRGDTNIKYLVDNNCHIWDGDAYKNYLKNFTPPECPPNLDVQPDYYEPMSKDMFIYGIKTDDEFSNKWGDLGRIYGAQWRKWRNPLICKISKEFSDIWDGRTHTEVDCPIDQISELITQLKETPDSRRMVVSAWAVHDLPNMVLPPCHYGFQVYTRELSLGERTKILNTKENSNRNTFAEQEGFMSYVCDKHNIPTRAISLMWNQRSVDTFLGLPFNIASYGLLLEIIAKEVNMIADELIGNLGDTHLYSNHIEQAKEQISRTPYELPKVEITERNWYQHQLVKEHLGPKTFSEKILSYRPDCFELIGYQSHPKIKAPLSN